MQETNWDCDVEDVAILNTQLLITLSVLFIVNEQSLQTKSQQISPLRVSEKQ